MDEFQSVGNVSPRSSLETGMQPVVDTTVQPNPERTKIVFLCNPCIDQIYSYSLKKEEIEKIKEEEKRKMFREFGFSDEANTLFGRDDILEKLRQSERCTNIGTTPAGSLRNTAATMQLLRKNITGTNSSDLVIAGPYSLRSSESDEDLYIKDLQSRGIEYRSLSNDDTANSRILKICCMTLAHGNGERYMASNTMKYPNTDSANILIDAKELLVEGYAYQKNEEVFDGIMKAASDKGVHVGFALSARGIVIDDKDRIMNLIDRGIIKTIYCNEEECKELLGDKYNDIAEFAKDKKLRILETLGSNGARLVDEEGKIHNIPLPEKCKVDNPDTLGAGDTFLGGYLTGKVLGLATEEDCIKFGMAAASQVLKVPEPIMHEDSVGEARSILAHNTGIYFVGGKPIYQIIKRQECDIRQLFSI